MEDILSLIFALCMIYVSTRLFKKFVLPKLIEMDTKEVERNPKWILGNVKKEYYGFKDIDVVLTENR
ncbi:MAG: hypothetical protein K2J20_05630, partial [Bacilli bacterium]|nr:hypothetical protein [Bacilli bacterium]